MRRLDRHASRGHWPSERAVATVTLDYDARHRRRIRLTLDDGAEALLDLDRTVALADGDGLRFESGEWVGVVAAPEALLEIRARDPKLRMRLAWHLGNRHVPAEITEESIRIRPDHVLRDMLVRLGAEVHDCQAPFQPERGAYHESHAHGGGHSHDHDHDHAPA